MRAAAFLLRPPISQLSFSFYQARGIGPTYPERVGPDKGRGEDGWSILLYDAPISIPRGDGKGSASS